MVAQLQATCIEVYIYLEREMRKPTTISTARESSPTDSLRYLIMKTENNKIFTVVMQNAPLCFQWIISKKFVGRTYGLITGN